MRWKSSLAGFALAACTAAARTPASPALAETDFAKNALWDDGRAELSLYRAREPRYGIQRDFRAALIVVKETFDPRLLTKSDAGRGFDVLKENLVLDLRTGVYEYHQMVSAYLDRRTFALVKYTLSSHEWCGNTFKEIVAGRGILHAHSYFDGEGDVDYPLDTTGLVAYEALPLYVRALDPARASRRIRLLAPQVSPRAPAPQVESAEVRIERGRVSVRGAGGATDAFDLDPPPTRLLRRWERRDGGRYQLESTRRMRYWEQNRPGDEKNLGAAVSD